MAQKIKPISLRLNVLKNWRSRWFADPKIRRFILEEDALIRQIINQDLREAAVVKTEIERTSNTCRVIITTARPGFIIGRGGKGIEELTKKINKKTFMLRRKNKISEPININLSVVELSRMEVSAQIIAQNIALDLEKRHKFRRIIKKYLSEIMSHKEVKGAKIKVSGRLDGAEIARREWVMNGKLPLANLRADIDYGEATAFTTYGAVGIKIWINKGEKFDSK